VSVFIRCKICSVADGRWAGVSNRLIMVPARIKGSGRKLSYLVPGDFAGFSFPPARPDRKRNYLGRSELNTWGHVVSSPRASRALSHIFCANALSVVTYCLCCWPTFLGRHLMRQRRWGLVVPLHAGCKLAANNGAKTGVSTRRKGWRGRMKDMRKVRSCNLACELLEQSIRTGRRTAPGWTAI
jgi:hypothetical protein